MLLLLFLIFVTTIRVVADGDVVPGVPPFSNYSHFGTEALIDGLGKSGSIIINPSYVEKKIIQKSKIILWRDHKLRNSIKLGFS